MHLLRLPALHRGAQHAAAEDEAGEEMTGGGFR